MKASQKYAINKFADLGAKAVLIGPILPVFAQKQQFLGK